MKLVRLGPDEVFHRYLTPKWAFVPTSGAGAAMVGGRFNRIGVEALYLSRAPQTALEEYRQGSSLTRPATLAAYKIDLQQVVDFSAGYDPNVWAAAWASWDCDWRKIYNILGKIPPSWPLADAAISAGYGGILFPSLRHPGGTNLVVFGANLSASDSVEVHDPDESLPKDQSSWPKA